MKKNGENVICGNKHNGSLDVNIQDQHSSLVELFLHDILASTTLASVTVVDDESVTVVSSTGMVTGQAIRLDGETNDQFQLWIRDDLTGLDLMTCTILGHVVED